MCFIHNGWILLTSMRSGCVSGSDSGT